MSPNVTKPNHPKAKVPERSLHATLPLMAGVVLIRSARRQSDSASSTNVSTRKKSMTPKLQSISDQLLSGAPELRTRAELGRVMAQLFTLIAQRKIRQREGALLAYVASLLLQTMLPTAAPAGRPVGVVWDIPMGEPSEEELQRLQRSQNSNPQFPNRA